MKRESALQHAPGGRLRWRLQRPLRRATRFIATTLSRVEKAGKVIDAAARFERRRPVAATQQYERGASHLVSAAASLGRAAWSLSETTAGIAIAGVPAGAPELLAETTALLITVAARLADTSNRMDAAFSRLLRDVQNGAIVPELVSDAPRRFESAPVILRTQTFSAARCLRAARRVSRGRAPPPHFACSLSEV